MVSCGFFNFKYITLIEDIAVSFANLPAFIRAQSLPFIWNAISAARINESSQTKQIFLDLYSVFKYKKGSRFRLPLLCAHIMLQ